MKRIACRFESDIHGRWNLSIGIAQSKIVSITIGFRRENECMRVYQPYKIEKNKMLNVCYCMLST